MTQEDPYRPSFDVEDEKARQEDKEWWAKLLDENKVSEVTHFRTVLLRVQRILKYL